MIFTVESNIISRSLEQLVLSRLYFTREHSTCNSIMMISQEMRRQKIYLNIYIYIYCKIFYVWYLQVVKHVEITNVSEKVLTQHSQLFQWKKVLKWRLKFLAKHWINQSIQGRGASLLLRRFFVQQSATLTLQSQCWPLNVLSAFT